MQIPEAQISGLPRVASDRVLPEVILTENVSSLPIDGTQAVTLWADKLRAVEPVSNAGRASA